MKGDQDRKPTRRDLPSMQGDFAEEESTDTLQVPVESFVQKPEPKARRGALVVLRGIETGRMVLLKDAITIIGRGKDVQFRYDDTGLSREHARIVRDGQHHFIEDLDSRNGTFLDGDRVKRAQLQDGARIVLSQNVVLRFNLVDEVDERVGQQLYDASTRDALTGLFNRRYFDERLASEVAYAHRHGALLGLVMIDIDHFKKINDTHGHLAGDAMLQAVARKMATLLRAEDVLARYGGEELVIIARGVPREGLRVLAERMRRALHDTSVPYQSHALRATMSAGVATLDECDAHATGDLLVALADERLYRAKREGRDRVCSE
jgi:two-component system, cell cycle response regulator